LSKYGVPSHFVTQVLVGDKLVDIEDASPLIKLVYELSNSADKKKYKVTI